MFFHMYKKNSSIYQMGKEGLREIIKEFSIYKEAVIIFITHCYSVVKISPLQELKIFV